MGGQNVSKIFHVSIQSIKMQLWIVLASAEDHFIIAYYNLVEHMFVCIHMHTDLVLC